MPKRRIRYYRGAGTLVVEGWIEQVQQACTIQGLAQIERVDLERMALRGHIAIATGSAQGDRLVGLLGIQAVEPEKSKEPEAWFQLGPFWVHPRYRAHERGGLPIASTLLHWMLDQHRHLNLVDTYEHGVRSIAGGLGMRRAGVGMLPPAIQARLRGSQALLGDDVLLSAETWIRIHTANDSDWWRELTPTGTQKQGPCEAPA